jgi:hypothetical protein
VAQSALEPQVVLHAVAPHAYAPQLWLAWAQVPVPSQVPIDEATPDTQALAPQAFEEVG